MEERRIRRAQKKADRSFIAGGEVSEGSETEKRLDKIKLPRGVFTQKQFAKLTDDKLRKLFREVDIDDGGTLDMNEF